MANIDYSFADAEAVCNDSEKDTWEVQATGTDGKTWTVSDSSVMTRDAATALAEDMRIDANDR